MTTKTAQERARQIVPVYFVEPIAAEFEKDAQRIEELENQLENGFSLTHDRISTLESKLATAKAALEFYANTDHWEGGVLLSTNKDFGDVRVPDKFHPKDTWVSSGKRAREALASLEDKAG